MRPTYSDQLIPGEISDLQTKAWIFFGLCEEGNEEERIGRKGCIGERTLR
uniref:Uncharacterized protein n=1 Tax=Arundo donax TaxID=35708 RepID=A0A0A9FQC3_ARUDO